MSKFNSKMSTGYNAVSYEGGAVYEKDVVEDWINNLFSSFLENRYYESGEDQMQRYMKLTYQVAKQLGWEFIAKASFFARNELGLRSIAQLTAAMLNKENFDQKRNYFRNFCHRPDDVAEIYAAIDMLGDKRSHALVRGTGDYLSGLNEYSLGKYKLNKKNYNMFDLINITHAHSNAINAYKNGTLTTPDTWEVAISTANDQETKNKEWKRLVEDNKLGYIALVRNLRNILSCDVTPSWVREYLVPQLTNKKAIEKSLIYPYQIYNAYKNLKGFRNLDVIVALDAAFRISCENMPDLPGKSVIFLDISGSMDSHMSEHSNMRIKEVGAVYAAALYVNNLNCDFIKFGTKAKKMKYNRLNNVFDLIDEMQNEDSLGYGTDISTAFNLLDCHYDRIFIVSDMQTMTSVKSWYTSNDGMSDYNKYCSKYGNAKCYSFDLGNYSTQTANPNNNNVFLLTALNDKIFDFIKLAERGGNIVDYIETNYDYR